MIRDRSRRRTSPALGGAVLVLALLAASCGGAGDDEGAEPPTASTAPPTTVAPTTTTTTDPRAWPADEWPRTTPAAAGIDPTHLDALAAAADGAASQCLVVTRDGELVGEWFWRGFEPGQVREAWSATKSVTATLVGIAHDDGLLDVDQPASDLLTEWQGTPSESVTIRNLLANDSGRRHTVAIDYGQMALVEADKTAFSIGLDQEHDPGTHWAYNNSAIQTLEAVLERATGQSVVDFAAERLFEPLGMHAHLTTDEAGNALVFMGMQSNCHDMARFGLLYLRGGEWDGQQVVSEAFVAEAVAPSQDLLPSYGLLWWLLGAADAATAPGQGDLSASGASGYAAIGLGDQVVAVFPDSNLVIARMGDGGGFGADEVAAWVADLDLSEPASSDP